MSQSPAHQRDPLIWTLVVTALFAVLVFIRLTIPTKPFFDEVHYLPAARAMIDMGTAQNMEHPPLAKEILAAGMLLFGDNPFGWRIFPALFGILSLFAMMRAMWFATLSRAASLLAGLYLVSNFMLLVQSRIAMLDIFMISFMMVSLWMCAAAVRQNETARWRLAVAGVALGASFACKWNTIPLAILPGLTFLIARIRQSGWRFLTARRGWPIGGMTVLEAGFWLGILPLAVYSASYWVFLIYSYVPTHPTGLISLHLEMLHLQEEVLKPHPYQSRWWDWVINWRDIWYFYEHYDGAQRGVMMVGNPISTIALLPALGWCGFMGWREKNFAASAIVVLYLFSMGLWVVVPKDPEFFYYYLLSDCFGMAALALATERMWRNGDRVVPYILAMGSVVMLAYYYPILTAARLGGPQAFLSWAWLPSWH